MVVLTVVCCCVLFVVGRVLLCVSCVLFVVVVC